MKDYGRSGVDVAETEPTESGLIDQSHMVGRTLESLGEHIDPIGPGSFWFPPSSTTWAISLAVVKVEAVIRVVVSVQLFSIS